MSVKQLSVFIENREGRLEQVTGILSEEQINILALSMADTLEFGILRMIVDQPEKAMEVLKKNGFSARITEVIAVRMENKPGQLHRITHILHGAGINIEYMYSMAVADKLAIIVKASNGTRASEALLSGGLKIFEDSEIM